MVTLFDVTETFAIFPLKTNIIISNMLTPMKTVPNTITVIILHDSLLDISFTRSELFAL